MKRTSILILTVIIIFCMLAGCAARIKPEEAQEISLTDQLGNDVVISEKPERIVSAYYISTSALIALGLEDNIVGIEDGAEKRPVYNMAAPDMLDSAVRVGSPKEFDIEACLSAEPDLVILPKKAQDYASSLQEVGVTVLMVNPEDHEKLLEMIDLIAEATGTQDRAEKISVFYDSALKEAETATANLADSDKPSVYMTSPSGYLSAVPRDMYQADVIRSAGGKNCGDVLEGDSRTEISYEQLLSMNPEIIIIPTNNFANGYPDYTKEDILNDASLSEVTAVKNEDIYYMPAGLEAWDSPVPSGFLGTLWTLAALHPDLYSMDQVADKAYDFYREFYDIEIDKILITG